MTPAARDALALALRRSGLTYKEIGARFNASPTAAINRIIRALRREARARGDYASPHDMLLYETQLLRDRKGPDAPE